MPLGEAQGHHAAVGGADDRMQRFQTQMQDDAAQRLGLVEGAQRREFAVRFGCRALSAASQIIDAEHAEFPRIDAVSLARHVRPPAVHAAHVAVRGNAAEHRDDGCLLGSDEAISEVRVRELIAVVQRATGAAAARRRRAPVPPADSPCGRPGTDQTF